MKWNSRFLNARGVVCLSLVMVVLAYVSSAAADDCFKHITVKNEGVFVTWVKIIYQQGGKTFNKPTGDFYRGQERRIAVPCDATNVIVNVCNDMEINCMGHGNVVDGLKFYHAEDRCFLLKGTYSNPSYQSCDVPGTPPIFPNKCWKQVTLKNEGAFLTRGRLRYKLQSERAEMKTEVSTGDFYHGHTKHMAVPCYADSELSVRTGNSSCISKTLIQNRDYCFVLKGAELNCRYELCAVAGGQTHSISIRNYAAYATELAVGYDYNGERMNPKTVIHAQRRGGISMPAQATNVLIKARAVAGKTILELTIPAARSLCYEVRGGTLTPRWAYCPQ
jgi:hypothetical protein